MNALKAPAILVGLALFCSLGAFAAVSDAPPPPPPEAQKVLYTKVFAVTPEAIKNLKKVKGIDRKKPVQDQLMSYLKQSGFEFKAPGFARYEPKQRALEVRANLPQLYRVEALLDGLSRGK